MHCGVCTARALHVHCICTACTLRAHCQALVTADCKMHCGVLCLVPGHVVLLKLYLSDNQRMSTSERLAVEPTNARAELTTPAFRPFTCAVIFYLPIML